MRLASLKSAPNKSSDTPQLYKPKVKIIKNSPYLKKEQGSGQLIHNFASVQVHIVVILPSHIFYMTVHLMLQYRHRSNIIDFLGYLFYNYINIRLYLLGKGSTKAVWPN
jgi:hypothetical protein